MKKRKRGIRRKEEAQGAKAESKHEGKIKRKISNIRRRKRRSIIFKKKTQYPAKGREKLEEAFDRMPHTFRSFHMIYKLAGAHPSRLISNLVLNLLFALIFPLRVLVLGETC